MKLCQYAECHCAERRDLFIGLLNVVVLIVVRLNVIMLSGVAPVTFTFVYICLKGSQTTF